MIEFTANTKDLKKALNVSALGIDDKVETITGVSVFKTRGNICLIYSTNNDKKALSVLSINGDDSKEEFAVNPKKISSFITNTDEDSLKLVYEPEKKTLTVSDSDKSYISLSCLDPDDFISFEDDYSNAEKVATVNADTFINGVKFVLGYTTTDEKSKYCCIFIKDGVIYGANGSTHIGIFVCDDMTDIATMVIRRQMVTPISALSLYFGKNRN